MWNEDPEILDAPNPVPRPMAGPGGSSASARCPANQTPAISFAVVVGNVTSIHTLLLPQSWKQLVEGLCPTMLTLALETPPIRMFRALRPGGFSLLATASNVSDGIAASVAPEKRVEQTLALTKPGRLPHSFRREPVWVSSAL